MFFDLLYLSKFLLSFEDLKDVLRVVMFVGIFLMYLFFKSVIPWLTSLLNWFILALTIIVLGSSFSLKWLIWCLLNKILPVLLIKYSHWIIIALKWFSFPDSCSTKWTWKSSAIFWRCFLSYGNQKWQFVQLDRQERDEL